MNIYAGSTDATGGTIIWSENVGAGRTIGGRNRSEFEYNMAPGNEYLFRFKNNTVNPNTYDYIFQWYELEAGVSGN